MSMINDLSAAIADQRIRLVDLTTPLSSETPALVLPEPFENLLDFSLEQISAYNEPGPFWKHHNIRTGEHIGTHLDAPTHWITGRNGKDVSQLELPRLVGPAVVIDAVEQAERDADFLLDIEHVQEWEQEHGELPENGWLLLRTGWEHRSHDRAAFLNADENGPHSPGFTVRCAQWLAEERAISGVGVETVGIDAGMAATMDPPFPVHYHLLGHDKYGVTLLRNLGQLPTTGALVVVSPLPVVGGTGSPARVVALVEAD